MEFDINITYTKSYGAVRYYDTDARVIWSVSDLGLVSGQWHHIKIVKDEDSITPTVDGVKLTRFVKSYPNTINKFSLIGDNSQMSNMKYKNFIFYSIDL